jgi:hypothetical protein
MKDSAADPRGRDIATSLSRLVFTQFCREVVYIANTISIQIKAPENAVTCQPNTWGVYPQIA